MSYLPTEPTDKSSRNIKRRITNLLWQRGVSMTALRRLDFGVENGTVTILGTVSSFYEWHICLSCCGHIPGVYRVVDNIKVERAGGTSEIPNLTA